MKITSVSAFSWFNLIVMKNSLFGLIYLEHLKAARAHNNQIVFRNHWYCQSSTSVEPGSALLLVCQLPATFWASLFFWGPYSAHSYLVDLLPVSSTLPSADSSVDTHKPDAWTHTEKHASSFYYPILIWAWLILKSSASFLFHLCGIYLGQWIGYQENK